MTGALGAEGGRGERERIGDREDRRFGARELARASRGSPSAPLPRPPGCARRLGASAATASQVRRPSARPAARCRCRSRRPVARPRSATRRRAPPRPSLPAAAIPRSRLTAERDGLSDRQLGTAGASTQEVLQPLGAHRQQRRRARPGDGRCRPGRGRDPIGSASHPAQSPPRLAASTTTPVAPSGVHSSARPRRLSLAGDQADHRGSACCSDPSAPFVTSRPSAPRPRLRRARERPVDDPRGIRRWGGADRGGPER